MASNSKRGPLQELPPTSIDEETPLLQDANGQTSDHGTLEAQAEQERREYDASHVPLADELPTSKLLMTMSTLWLCSFFAALDATVLATLSESISSSFQSGTSFSWIASGYLIANAATQPLSGKLTDIFGRRAGLIFASTFFATGTLICGLAPTANVMILGRIIAGAGGGVFNTVSVFVASDLIPLRKRGVWQGLSNVVFGAGMGLGGVYGGLIQRSLGWRYAFYIQVPFIVVGGILGCIMIKIPIKETQTAAIKRVDFLGALTLVTSLVLLLVGLNSGGNVVPWNHPLVLASLPLSFVMLLIFVYIEANVASEPIIPVRLLLNRSISAALLVNWFMTVVSFALSYYMPIFYRVVRNADPAESGLLFVPQAIGMSCGSLGAGIFMRWSGRYWWLHMGDQLLALLATALILGTFNVNLAPAPPFIYLAMQGMAHGAMLTITLLSLISAVDHKYQAVITSASYAFRSTGSTIGVTIASAVFQNLLKKYLFERFGDQPDAARRIREIRDSLNAVGHLPPEWREGVVQSFVDALRGVWVVAFGFAVLAAIASLFIREHKLHSTLARK